ncbi:alanine--tRNA ligase [Lishizhenia sp.]|uniref:alanine--tRNA ligase n=1 Tax=Lishizhenia sp. TaxID=2497594 RepID=UPI00299DE657|nr:alanine--tRNA ligase [Lishizhenia sp.]MDX1445859.1 alanine--tRNA ligase [Lishizhenia sp.]
MTIQEIRSQFLAFFESKNHKIVESAPMVIKNDPTLMFTNAGMNQFKDYFLGHSVPADRRVCDTQKCLRVSGKHNDLEEVGVDTYHHTMFEMLGNWSFGDYFKKEAIDWAWELLTEVYKIDKSRLYITVFEGDKEDGLDVDNEAFELWKEHVAEDRIILSDKKDNFWEMGDVGPCGPASEIHVDIRSDEERAKVDGKSLVNMDHPHVIEVWNLVFIQYQRKANGSLEKLPETHIDTGMGLERLAMVLQGKQSNYDTDLFQSLIQHIAKVAKVDYGKKEETDIALRVIADHVRAIAFSICDGQLPSNTGAGYVIRRILRRAVRYGYSVLNLNESFMADLSKVLVQEMGEAFPQLESQKELVEKVIREEENSFFRTLEQGIKRMDAIMDATRAAGSDVVNGDAAFELYDTFGFPFDLTLLIAKENKLTVDEKGFEACLNEQKERSRAATSVETEDWISVAGGDDVDFIGYDNLEADVKITKYRKVTQKKKSFYQLVFNQTPFYAEGGGQVGDKGYIENGDGKVAIFDTKKENNLIVHLSTELPKDVEATFKAVVNETKRNLSASNHSATHLLHHALREVLGDHVEQKGSLVNDKYLRFDFSHFSKVTDEEIEKIEAMVTQQIRANIALDEKRAVAMEEAQNMGAMALFGEKYGDKVRVIKFGDSVELCGGTHVGNTGEIGLFKITSEGAVAAGVRRIEAITNAEAENFYKEKANTVAEVASLLKNPKNLAKSVEDLIEKNKQLSKQIEAFQKEKATMMKSEIKSKVEEMDGFNFIGTKAGLDGGSIKDILFQLKGEVENLFAVIGGEADGKCTLSIIINDDLAKAKNLNAGQLVREASKFIQGGGGGQAAFATAGGKNPAGLDDAIALIKEKLA